MSLNSKSLTLAAISLTAAALGACGASLPGTTTGSLFGGSAPAAPAVQNDPTTRALQVGTVAARAQKCGYNFDPVKLRTQYLTSETALLANPSDADKLGQIYDTAYRGVGKAVAGEGEAYCSPQKTARIKAALTRHLAGDYTPDPPEPVVEEDSGLFGSASSSGVAPNSAPGLDH